MVIVTVVSLGMMCFVPPEHRWQAVQGYAAGVQAFGAAIYTLLQAFGSGSFALIKGLFDLPKELATAAKWW